jgi:uncharacterized protein (TIGR02391 family)
MNIEAIIDQTLWNTLRTNYENRNFTGAILDSIYHMSNIIRDKTGLESDGVALVGQAFGGKTPKLRLTELKSETDLNIQTGIEQILRGVFQAIRNPRSHEKYEDEQKEADSIIVFIDYLLGKIDKSRTQFSRQEMVQRVFDNDFVESDRYAELLVDEIPPKQRFEILLEVFRKKETGNGKKLSYFFKALYSKLDENDKSEYINIISDELKKTDDTNVIRTILQIFPCDDWIKINEAARLRTENKLIKNIKQGRMNTDGENCSSGAFGTWATNIIKQFSLKDDLCYILAEKLASENALESDYVFKFFFSYLEQLSEKIHWSLKNSINKGLERGDIKFFNALDNSWLMVNKESIWYKTFYEKFESFKEAEPQQENKSTVNEDDLPF